MCVWSRAKSISSASSSGLANRALMTVGRVSFDCSLPSRWYRMRIERDVDRRCRRRASQRRCRGAALRLCRERSVRAASSCLPAGRSARIANGRRRVERQRVLHHRQQLGFAARRHERHVRQRAQVGDVVEPHVRRAVVADEAGAVHAEHDREDSARRRRGRFDRTRAAGTSSRSRRSGAGRSTPAPAAKHTACASAMPTSK